MLLNNHWAKNVKRSIKKCFEINEMENTTYCDLGDSTKSVLRRKFIVKNVYVKKQEKSQTNDPGNFIP